MPSLYVGRELGRLAADVDQYRFEENVCLEHRVSRAVAFYHLRFEAIHPLVDGNGRVGRFILAKQCAESLGGGWHTIESGIRESAAQYRSVFLSDVCDSDRFALLADLVNRLIGGDPCLPTHIFHCLVPQNCTRVGRQFRFTPIEYLT